VEQKVKETEIDYRKGTIDGKYAKYDRGDKINTLEELFQQDVFIWMNTTKNKAWLESQQLRWIKEHVLGYAYKCVLKKKHKYNSNNNITKEGYINKLDSEIKDLEKEEIESIVYQCKTSINSKFRIYSCYLELPYSKGFNSKVLSRAGEILSKEYPFLDFEITYFGYSNNSFKNANYRIEWFVKQAE